MSAPPVVRRATWLATRWHRLTGPGRVAGIDLARGLAVIGMFAAHLIELPGFDWGDARTWGAVVDGRSSILFATLAGVSIGLVTGGRRLPVQPALGVARRRLALRAALIWALGVMLITLQVPVLVILPAYALLFLLVLPLLRLRAGALFALAVALAAVTPLLWAAIAAWPLWASADGALLFTVLGLHYPFVVWVAFLTAGLGIARLGVASAVHAALLAVAGAAFAALGYGVAELGEADLDWAEVLSSSPHSSGVGEAIGSGGVAVAVIGLCVLLCRTPLTWVALPLRAVGSMPLSAYAVHLVAWALLQPEPGPGESDLTAFRALDPFVPFAVTALIGCTAWALLVGRGPLEWALDRTVRWVVPDRLDR